MDVEDVKRLCATWRTLFDHDGPTALRARPIISSAHPLRKEAAPEWLLEKEIKKVDECLYGTSPIIPHTMNDLTARARVDSFDVARKIALRPYSKGYHETRMKMFEYELLRYYSPPTLGSGPVIPTTDIAGHMKNKGERFVPHSPAAQEFTCYFGLSKGNYKFDYTTMNALYVYISAPEKLPQSIRDHVLRVAVDRGAKSAETWYDSSHYIIFDRVSAIDASRAVDLAIDKADTLRSLT